MSLAALQEQRSLLTDTNSYPTPDIPKPAYRVPIIDPVFGTTITRITDAGQPIDNPTGD